VHSTDFAYGLWSLVIVNSAIFLFLAFSFWHPKTKRDWRAFGAFSAFIIALFTEMYGFPLTIYLLAPWLQKRFPGTNVLSHDFGHLWNDLIRWKGDPHLSPFHITSNLLIFGGLILLWWSWNVLYSVQKSRALATTGPYAYVRHPQYVAFIAVMFGFVPSVADYFNPQMFPILVAMYVHLARSEEGDVRAEFGDAYERYARKVPAFVPRFGSRSQRPLFGAE